MARRPRCARGHFLPTAGDCRCTRPRIHWDRNLWGQGLTSRQLHSIRTVPLSGSYL